MNEAPSLLATLNLALRQLEAVVPQAKPDPDSEDARPNLRGWIEALQRLEGDHWEAMGILHDTFLARKGIFIVGWTSAQKVRAILQANGFGHLSHEATNRSILAKLDESLIWFDLDKTMQEILEKIENETARDLVKEVGLDWAEPPET